MRSDLFSRGGLAETDVFRRIYAPFPYPGAAIDMDFVRRVYWWGGASKLEADFTTFTLNGSTFDAKGLNIAPTIDVTLSLSGLGTFFPGAFGFAGTHASVPAAQKVFWLLDNGGTAERVMTVQNTTGTMGLSTVGTATVQGSINAGTGTVPLGVKHGVAASYDANDFKMAGNGVNNSPDVSGTATVGLTTLRIGKSLVAGSEALGSVARIVVFQAVMTQNNLRALSIAMRDGS